MTALELITLLLGNFTIQLINSSKLTGCFWKGWLLEMYTSLFLHISSLVASENPSRTAFVEHVDLSEAPREGFAPNHHSPMLKCAMMIIICVYPARFKVSKQLSLKNRKQRVMQIGLSESSTRIHDEAGANPSVDPPKAWAACSSLHWLSPWVCTLELTRYEIQGSWTEGKERAGINRSNLLTPQSWQVSHEETTQQLRRKSEIGKGSCNGNPGLTGISCIQ